MILLSRTDWTNFGAPALSKFGVESTIRVLRGENESHFPPLTRVGSFSFEPNSFRQNFFITHDFSHKKYHPEYQIIEYHHQSQSEIIAIMKIVNRASLTAAMLTAAASATLAEVELEKACISVRKSVVIVLSQISTHSTKTETKAMVWRE